MKKRTSVEWAVIVMAVVVVLLAIALIVVNAAGIRIHKPAPEAPVATNLPQFPFSDEPELILGSGQAPSRDAQQAVSVGGVDKTMQLVNGSFAQRGGPDFSLYLDASVFLSTEMDGKCCFARADDTSMDAYLEIGYHPGADAQTLGMTTTYLRMLWCFGPFFVMNNVLLAFTRNDGAPTVAMCGMIAGSLFNIVFDYIFIFPCGLGMFGAALATGFSPFVSILVLLTHLRRPSRGFHLVKTPLRVSRVPSLCAPGLSSLIGEIASGVVLLLFNLVLLRLSGNTGVAAYGVVANLALVGIAVFTGLCTGIQPLVSRSSGLGDREQLRRLFRWGICTALGIAAVLCVSIFLGAEPLTAVFNSEHDPQLAAYAESGLRIYFTGFLFAGVNMVTAAFFSASDKTVQGFVLSLLRGVIAVPPILFPLAWVLGVDGVWLTFPMVELVTAVAALVWARKYIIKN